MLLNICPIEWGIFMFKKININELLVIGVGILATCFVISKFAFCKFGMQSDFLSASGTLFAALVATKLFNDWRSQYITELFERTKNRIHDLFMNAESAYDKLYFLLITHDTKLPNKKEVVMYQNAYQSAIEILATELDFYEKLLTKYIPTDVKINCPPSKSKSKILTHMREINPRYTKGEYEEYLTSIRMKLLRNEIYSEQIQLKIYTNDDLQKIVIRLLSK